MRTLMEILSQANERPVSIFGITNNPKTKKKKKKSLAINSNDFKFCISKSVAYFFFFNCRRLTALEGANTTHHKQF